LQIKMNVLYFNGRGNAMNTLLKPLFVACAIISLPAICAVTDTTANEAKFSFEGTVEPTCKTDSGSNAISGLDLSATAQTQDIGTLEVWCNTGENATTQYTSANGGYLVSDNAQASKLAYTLNVGDTAGIDLQNGAYTHLKATLAGTGVTGDTKATSLKITPQTNGLNDAGTYSDTITVTVSSN
jgi:spore coat protein U-like protein